jgi:chromosome segregation ATPase
LNVLTNFSKHQFQCQQIADATLPEFINQTLTINAHTDQFVKNTTEENARLQCELDDIRRQFQTCQHRNVDLDNELKLVSEKLSFRDDKLNQLEFDCQQHMNEATDLTEKQNALMISLEAKVRRLAFYCCSSLMWL